MAKINFRKSEKKAAPSHIRKLYNRNYFNMKWNRFFFSLCFCSQFGFYADVIRRIINNYFHMNI